MHTYVVGSFTRNITFNKCSAKARLLLAQLAFPKGQYSMEERGKTVSNLT